MAQLVCKQHLNQAINANLEPTYAKGEYIRYKTIRDQ